MKKNNRKVKKDDFIAIKPPQMIPAPQGSGDQSHGSTIIIQVYGDINAPFTVGTSAPEVRSFRWLSLIHI